MARTKQTLWVESALALALFILMSPAGSLRAQESAKPANTTAPSQAQPAHPSPKREGEEQLEQGGEADAIRHSPAVKRIARYTGLTDNQAYWACIALNFA